MAKIYSGQIFDYSPETRTYHWFCGNDACHARTNPPVAIKGRERVAVVCQKCKGVNQVSKYR